MFAFFYFSFSFLVNQVKLKTEMLPWQLAEHFKFIFYLS